MGQGFSLTSNSTRVAQLERDLASEKGKCSKNDVIISDLQREVQGLKKQNMELEEVTEANKQLESENQQLEKQIETLSATSDATNTNRTKLEACNTRAQELRNANIALLRKLEASNTRAVTQRGASEPSPKIAALQGRVRSLETMVKQQRSELVRITMFSSYNLIATTYKRTWSVGNPQWMRWGIQGELRIGKPQVSYKARFRFRDNVLTIFAMPTGVRRVLDAGAIWEDLLKMVGQPPRRIKLPSPAPKPREVNTPIKPVKPKGDSRKPIDVKPTPRPLPKFSRRIPRPWETKDEKKEENTIAVGRPYRRDVAKPTTTIAGPFRRTTTSPDGSPKTKRRPGRRPRRQRSPDKSPDKRKRRVFRGFRRR